MSKKLINDAASCVNDAVEGLLLTDARLMRVGNLNILVRQDILQIRDTYVSIISGGGSGHEPAHAGFVGEGMLSAAVCGNVFASPSVSAIVAAIRVCGGKKGVLLVVKNYTGDRLNFGMAMEKAKQEGIACQMVIVDDDCALQKGKGITGGRGVAGTVFIHKVVILSWSSSLMLLFLIPHPFSHIHPTLSHPPSLPLPPPPPSTPTTPTTPTRWLARPLPLDCPWRACTKRPRTRCTVWVPWG